MIMDDEERQEGEARKRDEEDKETKELSIAVSLANRIVGKVQLLTDA